MHFSVTTPDGRSSRYAYVTPYARSGVNDGKNNDKKPIGRLPAVRGKRSGTESEVPRNRSETR